jgi:hypothetical protein
MNGAFIRIAAAWNRFWFQPEPPAALGACRILFYGGLFVAFAGIDFTPLCQVAQSYWRPTSFYRIFFLHGPFSTAVTVWLQAAWKISLLVSMAGLFTRVSTAISGLLGLYLVGLTYNFGKLDHDMAVTGLILLMLPFSECGRVWSLDRRISRWRGRAPAPLTGEEARWPIQFGRVAIALLMFGAGFNKMRRSGPAWITTDTLQTYLLLKQAPLGLWMAQWPLLCHGLAGFSVATELFYPLALFSRRLARVWVPAGLAMFTGIYLLMDVSFFFLMFLNFFWLPWWRLFPGGEVPGPWLRFSAATGRRAGDST